MLFYKIDKKNVFLRVKLSLRCAVVVPGNISVPSHTIGSVLKGTQVLISQLFTFSALLAIFFTNTGEVTAIKL